MYGLSGQGCTHQGPLRAYTTICCPGFAPCAFPAITSTFSRPPCAAGGTLVISTVIVLPLGVLCAWHPLNPAHIPTNHRTAVARMNLALMKVVINMTQN